MEWHSILSKTNVTPNLVRDLQATLNAKGCDDRTIDTIVDG